MKSWTLTTIGAVAEVSGGLTKNAKRDAFPLKRPYLTVANVYSNRLDLTEVGEIGVQETELSRTTLQPGDLLVVEGNGSISQLGRVALWTGAIPGCLHQNHLIKIRVAQGVAPKWVLYWMMSPDGRAAIEKVGSSTSGLHTLSISKVEALPVKVYPLPEQHRIIAAVETHFSRIDDTVASLNRAKANVKRARASVLKAAVEGRLVPNEAALTRAEGRDYEPASALLARILTERRARWAENGGKGKYKEPSSPESTALADLPSGWTWASMEQLLNSIEAGKSFTAENVPPASDQVGILKVSAVTWGRYDETESKTVLDPAQVNPNYFVRPGDLLFSRANTIDLIGAVVFVERVTRSIMLSDKILRLNMSQELKRWVLWTLRSQNGRRQIESLSTGNQESMRNIGQDRIRQIAVPLPPAAEQRRIVAEVDRRLSVLDALDATLDANLARCAKLRQSILKRAFEGKLIRPDDPRPAAPQLPLFTEEAAP